MVAVAEPGSGRVVSISDANLWNNWDWDYDGSADLYDRDNLQFGLNVIAWLADVAPRPAPSALTGEGLERGLSEHSVSLSEGSLSGRPVNRSTLAPTEIGVTTATDLGREHEEAVLDSDGNVTRIVNTIALYGDGSMTINDAVPAGATITFDEAPSSDYISGTQRILVWNEVVSGYHRVVYTATNVSPSIPTYANVTASLVPSQAPSSSQSTVYLKLTADVLRDVPVLLVTFDVPKSTPQADVFVGETEIAAVFDEGDHYCLVAPLGPAHEGTQRTGLIPLIISPKQQGTFTLIDNVQVTVGEAEAAFLTAMSYLPGSSTLTSRSATWPLASLSLQVASQATDQAVLQLGNDGYAISLSQGQSVTRTLYIENIGTAAAQVDFSLTSPTTKPDGSEYLDPAWVDLPSSVSLGAGISTTVTWAFDIPVSAGVTTYIGTLNVSDGSQLYLLPLQINVSERGLIKHLLLDTSPDNVPSLIETTVEVCVSDDFGAPVPSADIILSGAAVDVEPAQTGADGCASFAVRPLEAGQIRVKGAKEGYVQGEAEIRVQPPVFLPIVMANFEADTAYNWIDATSGGTIVADGDDTYEYVSLPFTFDFYGNTYNGLYVSSNGFVSFGSGYTTYSNGCIPSTGTPNNAIYAFWDDLVPTGGSNGNVYVKQIDDDTFVIEWYQVRKYGTSDYQTFEIVLRSDHSITLQYQSVSNTDSATVGVENSTGTLAQQYVCNGAGTPLTNQLAIRYITP